MTLIWLDMALIWPYNGTKQAGIEAWETRSNPYPDPDPDHVPNPYVYRWASRLGKEDRQTSVVTALK